MVVLKAHKFIAKHDLESLNFSVDKLKEIGKTYDWKIGSYKDNKKILEKLELTNRLTLNGFTYYLKENNSTNILIFYKDDLEFESKLFTILHEIGHIVLNHTIEDNFTELQEKEANEFACEVLAPSCTLKGRVSGIDELRRVTNLPAEFCEEHLIRISKFKQMDSSSKVVNSLLRNYIDGAEKEMKSKKHNKGIAIACGIVGIAVAGILFAINVKPNNAPQQNVIQETSNTSVSTKYISKETGNIVPLSSTVYLTKTGKSFHLDLDCS